MMASPKHNLAGNARGITTRANRLTPIVSREVEDNGPAELTGSSLKVSQVISEIIVLLHLFCGSRNSCEGRHPRVSGSNPNLF